MAPKRRYRWGVWLRPARLRRLRTIETLLRWLADEIHALLS